jgi:hypothetical protein
MCVPKRSLGAVPAGSGEAAAVDRAEVSCRTEQKQDGRERGPVL